MLCGTSEQIQPRVVIKTCPDQSILAPPHPDVKHDPFTSRQEMQQLHAGRSHLGAIGPLPSCFPSIRHIPTDDNLRSPTHSTPYRFLVSISWLSAPSSRVCQLQEPHSFWEFILGHANSSSPCSTTLCTHKLIQKCQIPISNHKNRGISSPQNPKIELICHATGEGTEIAKLGPKASPTSQG